MANTPNWQIDLGQALVYQIRLAGHLSEQWTGWFGGLTITLADNGDTLLTGPVADQAALYGLLRKVRDVGIPLLAVNRVQLNQIDASDNTQFAWDITKFQQRGGNS